MRLLFIGLWSWHKTMHSASTHAIWWFIVWMLVRPRDVAHWKCAFLRKCDNFWAEFHLSSHIPCASVWIIHLCHSATMWASHSSNERSEKSQNTHSECAIDPSPLHARHRKHDTAKIVLRLPPPTRFTIPIDLMQFTNWSTFQYHCR